MSFKIENKKEETLMKSIRFPKALSNEITKISNKNNITFSKFIILACNYALDNLEDNKKVNNQQVINK